MKNRSLSAHIIRNVLLFCMALFLLSFSVYYYFARKTIQETTRENAIYLANSTVNSIEQVLNPAEKIPEVMALMLESGLLDRDSIIPFLKSVLSNNPDIYGSTIAYEPGYFPDKGLYFAPYVYRQGNAIKEKMLGAEDYEYFYLDWYQIPKMTATPYWTEPYFDAGGGDILMTGYSMPFYTFKDGKKSFAGIVTIDISLDWLTELISSVKILESGYAFLLSRNGVILTHPDKTLVMNQSIFSLAKETNQPGMREIGREMIQGKSNVDSAPFSTKWSDKKLWVNYRSLPSSQWSIGIIYPDNEMYASLYKTNLILLLIILTGLLLLSIFTTKIINKLTSPLKHFADSARLIAAGDFNVKLPEIHTKDEMQELFNAFTFMQKELADYIENLKTTTASKEKIESELRIASEIQMSMIPRIFPPFPNLQQVEAFGMLKSAREVGGDFFDFFALDGQKFCFAIGDVSGKGVPASLFMAVTRTLVRSISEKENSAREIVRTLNNALTDNNEACMFVTFFLGILDLNTGKLTYCNAGHNAPLLIRHKADITFFEKSIFLPVGIDSDYPYQEYELQLARYDQVFLYTDGVNEAENAEKVIFGDDRLIALLRENANASPPELVHKLSQGLTTHVNGYPQSDDITMLTLKYNG